MAMGRPLLVLLCSLIIILFLMGFRLGSLVPGLNETETETIISSNSLGAIMENPINAPYKIGMYVVTRFTSATYAVRLISAFIGSAAILLFYLLVRKLLQGWVAIATTLLFATSSLLLHFSRMASADTMWLGLLALVGIGWLLRFDRHTLAVWLLACTTVSLALYVPGLAIFVTLAAIWQFRRIRPSFDQLPPLGVAACALLVSILSLPLIVSLIREPTLWRGYLGLPAQLGPLSQIIHSALQVGESLFIRAPHDPAFWLGRQPILDVFSSIMFVYGIAALTKQYKLDRTVIFLGIFLISLLWLGLTGNPHGMLLLLPFAYLLVGIGIHHLLKQWLEVFPRNPIARWLGISLLVIVIGAAANFQARRYFIAWPHNADTKAAFQQV